MPAHRKTAAAHELSGAPAKNPQRFTNRKGEPKPLAPTGVTTVVIPPSPAQLSPAMKELRAAVYDEGHPILTWSMGNVLSRETPFGNLTMPDSRIRKAKIDPAVALSFAQWSLYL